MRSSTSPKAASFIVSLAAGFVGIAAAQSQVPPRLAELAGEEGCEFPETPTVPEAESATMEQMVETQGQIQTYIEESNELLECLDEISQNEELPVEDRQTVIDGYNAEVATQEALAELWNVRRTRFLELQQQ